MEHAVIADPIKRDAASFLEVFTDGRKEIDQATNLLDNMDQTLGYFLVRFLRENRRVCGDGTRSRLVQFAQDNPKVAKIMRQPPDEPLAEWFDSSYTMNDFSSTQEFIDLIVDKIEG